MPPLTEQAKRLAAATDRAAIFAAFKKTRGNARAAAELLGVAMRTLNERIVELGIRETLTTRYPRRSRPRRKLAKK